MKTTGRLGSGFTLIELLVVIAIIALLLSILLPSLHAAKEIAYSSVCMSHLRGAGGALSSYTTNNDDWMPGPNTSGMPYTLSQNIPLSQSSSSAYPTQNMDWVSPTLGEELGLSDRGYNRLADIFNSEFKCPSNKKLYDYFYDGSEQPIDGWIRSANPGVTKLYYSSYSAILGFHVWNGARVFQSLGAVTFPSHYRPKLRNINMPGRKVYAIDGARYISPQNPPLSSFNEMPYQDDGGNFMLYGPPLGISGDPFTSLAQEMVLPGRTSLREAPNRSSIFRDYAYRHREGLNAVFFDGHCEHMSWKESLHISYYLPSGSQIIRAVSTADPDDINGQIIR